ncbi:hypothetical protein [Dipodfec virus RodF1_47]|uniref:Uncharacterized protein n=1 Tax=Dipodfec virus RodF1_47 TaxID=2929298 RepID=A0A976N315_9VIRU|nr:hypothetical protein [Dipodfec virus RodF1_47]
MKRLIRSPQSAQAEFSKYAYRIHPQNMVGSYMRGGIRL